MSLVLQCAMCGTHHPVGTTVCSTCRATGVTRLRLMFECQRCGALDISPACEACAVTTGPVGADEDLIIAEEVPDDELEFFDLPSFFDEAESADVVEMFELDDLDPIDPGAGADDGTHPEFEIEDDGDSIFELDDTD